MKCLKLPSNLLLSLAFFICLAGCFGMITEAEPDPNQVIELKLGDTQSFRVDGYTPNITGRFEWESSPNNISGDGKNFGLVLDSSNDQNKAIVTCSLSVNVWMYLSPGGVLPCGGWYLPPCGWNNFWSEVDYVERNIVRHF